MGEYTTPLPEAAEPVGAARAAVSWKGGLDIVAGVEVGSQRL